MHKTFPVINEDLCKKIKFISSTDADKICENRQKSTQKLSTLLFLMSEGKLTESDSAKINSQILREAQKLERLLVIEGVSDKNFYEVQKNFRSMVRAANIIVKWFVGSSLASKVETLRTQGIELLNDLYEDIKNVEAGVDVQKTGLKMSPEVSKSRDQFMKVFADFAIIFRGCMALADLFTGEDRSEMEGILSSLDRDELSSINLRSALVKYDFSNDSLKGHITKNLSKKGNGLFGQFQRIVTQTLAAKTPGFQKFVSIEEIIEVLMRKSVDQLRAYFERFNQFVAADVDVEFLLNVSKTPRTIGSMFKSLWTAFGSGGGKTMNI